MLGRLEESLQVGRGVQRRVAHHALHEALQLGAALLEPLGLVRVRVRVRARVRVRVRASVENRLRT